MKVNDNEYCLQWERPRWRRGGSSLNEKMVTLLLDRRANLGMLRSVASIYKRMRR
jgi:hypothetical protein